jgi:hypothetical protein
LLSSGTTSSGLGAIATTSTSSIADYKCHLCLRPSRNAARRRLGSRHRH